jgi:hypothetical protein
MAMVGTAATAMKARKPLIPKKTTLRFSQKEQRRLKRLGKRWEMNQSQTIRKALILAEAVA